MRARFITVVGVCCGVACTQYGPEWDTSTPADLPVRTWGSGTPIGPPTPGTATFRPRLGPSANMWWDSVGSETDAPEGPLMPAGTLGFTPAVVFDGKAIGVASTGLTAYDLREKKALWTTPGSFDPTWVATDRTNVCDYLPATKELTCLRAADGTSLFKVAINMPTGAGEPEMSVRDGTVFFLVAQASWMTNPQGTLSAFDATTGASKWSRPVVSSARGLVFANGRIVVDQAVPCAATGKPCLEALDPKTGAVLASKALPDIVAGDGSTQPNKANFQFVAKDGKLIYGVYGNAMSGVSSFHSVSVDPTTLEITDATTEYPMVASGIAVYGVTELLADGTMYIIVNPSAALQLCHVDVVGKKKLWCTTAPKALEIHKNAVLADGRTLDPLTGVEKSRQNNVTTFRESWGFDNGSFYALQ